MAVIYYMSGTGNSLSVAQQLGQLLNARIEGMSAYLAAPYLIEDEVVGIVTPVYCLALPALAEKFLQQVQLGTPRYLFCVATMGAMAGQTLAQARKILTTRKQCLTAGFSIALPDNSIVFPSPAKHKALLLSREKTAVGEIALAVKQRQVNSSHLHRNPLWRLVTVVGWWVLRAVYKVDEKKVYRGQCIKCGLCAKICPTQAITMENGYPVFKAGCTNCFGCAHWCPEQAITLGRLTPTGTSKYVHPQTSAQTLAKQKELRK
ncbi:MAG: EFR1 family ferrodoxin [Acidaminococcaceae bacterium]